LKGISRTRGIRIWAHFFGQNPKKPGYPLQVLESADALSAGFPLLSLAHCRDFAPQNPARTKGLSARSQSCGSTKPLLPSHHIYFNPFSLYCSINETALINTSLSEFFIS
jgi:hypothetical protein